MNFHASAEHAWRGVPGTNIEIALDDHAKPIFRWTFDLDGAHFIATELHPDGTAREMFAAITAAEEMQRIHDDTERFGIAIVMVPRER